MRTHYNVLGIPRDADGEQIRVAYRHLAKTYHPDLNQGNESAARLFKQITDAYKVLHDPLQRRAYDGQLKIEEEGNLEEFNIPPSPAKPARAAKGRSVLTNVTRVAMAAAAAVGVLIATYTHLSDPRGLFSRRVVGEPVATDNYAMTPATAAELAAGAATPRLFVSGGQAPVNFAVPLVIALQGSVSPDAIIMIRGLPFGTSFSAGEPIGTNGWRLPVSDLFNVSIRGPQDFAGMLDLTVELRLADDTVADRRPLRVWWIATPVSPPSQGLPPVEGPQPPVTPPVQHIPVPPAARPGGRTDLNAGVAAVQQNQPQIASSVMEERPVKAVPKSSSLYSPFRDCQLCPEMVPVKGGYFFMGSDDDPTEKPIHHVIVKPYVIGRFPVTIKEWKHCVAAKACSYEIAGEDDTPVRNLSWDDTQQYITWLNQIAPQKYRLPTESEWEFAARAKTTTKYWWGDRLISGMANCAACGEPYSDISPAKVGSFTANPLGLYDMAGGVSQWVSDCWHNNYANAPADGTTWNAAICREHVLRGGSWLSDAIYLRSSNRDHYDSNVRYPTHGFRVARSSVEAQLQSNGN